MSVKIKISYTDERELEEKVIRRLAPVIKAYKKPKQQQGAYKKLYLTLKE